MKRTLDKFRGPVHKLDDVEYMRLLVDRLEARARGAESRAELADRRRDIAIDEIDALQEQIVKWRTWAFNAAITLSQLGHTPEPTPGEEQ